MYHDFAGREIEDPEMDAMLQEMDYIDAREAAKDARELAHVERLRKATTISARMVHEAFISAESTSASWEQVSDAKKALYEKMAARLNDYLLDAIRLDCATQEPGYVWSAEEESDHDDYEMHITPEGRRESQAWKAAAALATEHRCNWSVEAQRAGIEEQGDE
jgi:hypothetical protein